MASGRQRRAGELRVVVDLKELEFHTYTKCRNGRVFPKKDRGGLPSRMMDEATDAVACAMDANDLDLRDAEEGRERLELQRRSLRALRKLTHHIEMAHRLKALGEDEFAFWAKMAVDCRNRTAAWHKSDKGRYAAMHG